MQDLIQAEASQIYTMVVYERGHFYVCGDCTMAEDVYQTLKQIIQTHGQMTDKEVEAYMLTLRVYLSFIFFFIVAGDLYILT